MIKQRDFLYPVFYTVTIIFFIIMIIGFMGMMNLIIDENTHWFFKIGFSGGIGMGFLYLIIIIIEDEPESKEK